MRITYLKLKGYANIFAGLRRKSIEVDLRKSKRKIVLIMGDNGSGKTSILSQLQPYPFTVGDNREGKGIILENEEGYKEIHYDVNGVIYVIKHYISTTGTVKSYMTKDGEELNPNGNVRSFEEVVEACLHITKDTLQLMRLGTNSSTFIKMSSAKRKSFTGDLLSDLNVYTALYKKMNDDFRNIRTLMKSVTSKMETLNIHDVEGFKSSIKDMVSYVDTSKDAREDIVGIRSINRNRIDELGGMDQAGLYLARTLLETNISHLSGLIRRGNITPLEEVKDEMNKLGKEIISLESQLELTNSRINDALDRRDKVSYELTDVSSKLQMLTSKGEVTELTTLLTNVDRKIKDLEDKFKDFKTEATLADFKRLLEVYKELDRVVSISHGFDHQAIVNVVALFINSTSVEKHLNKEYRDAVNKLESAKAKMIAKQSGKNSDDAPKMVIFKDMNCSCSCPFEEFYDAIMNNDSLTITNIRDKVYEAEKEIDLIDEKFAIMSNINLIKMTIEANSTLISKLPSGSMVFEDVITRMANSMPIYDEGEITSFITLMEDFERINDLKVERLELKEELSKMRASSDVIVVLNSSLLKYQEELHQITVSINKYTDEVAVIENKLQDTSDSVESWTVKLKEVSEVDDLRQELKVDEGKLIKVNNDIDTYENAVSKLKEIETSLSSLDSSIMLYENKIQEGNRRLGNHEELQNELKLLNERYDKIVLMRDAVSSTKGIPLIYIKIFMSDINSYINNLVRRVYGGSLEIDEFIINEKEFTIPYFKNGIKVPDISMISQGEETFVSLATTFSFLRRALGDYNVIGADELDGPLDESKRHQFLDIIETELESMGIEQFFLISHNEVFNTYPVDCILTTDKDISSFKNIKVVYNAAI